jgi:hypothetical protein
MAECIKCGQFTKYNGGLCTKCYNEKNNNDLELEEADIQEGGLTDKERNYRYGMIKGRIAETLIQELFLSLKYNVFRYGMENTIPGGQMLHKKSGECLTLSFRTQRQKTFTL